MRLGLGWMRLIRRNIDLAISEQKMDACFNSLISCAQMARESLEILIWDYLKDDDNLAIRHATSAYRDIAACENLLKRYGSVIRKEY